MHEGGFDPNARLEEMAVDGVSAEVLYPTLALNLFGLGPEDAPLQEQAFQIYNDWIAQYCQVAPDRLVGIGLLSSYNTDHAITEMQRCRDLGMPGVMIWQVPHPDFPMSSRHYDPLWEAAQELDLPVSMHILSGHDWGGKRNPDSHEFYRKITNLKLLGILNTVYDLIYSGVFDRYPRLRVALVENEIGWIPWILQLWDRYYNRTNKSMPIDIELAPSEYFRRNIWATFFDDRVGASLLGPWGVDNCMWSNDFPHANSTWPHSRETIATDLAHLSAEDRTKVLCTNVTSLYKLTPPTPLT